MISQIALVGLRIDNVSMDETVAMIDRWIDDGSYHQIATANVDFLRKAADDPVLMDILHGCDLVLADGMPLVWASRLMKTPLKERVTGADLFPRLLELSSRRKRRIFLLGATEERSLSALGRMRREYPEARICGRLSPPVAALEDVQNEQILAYIEDCKPDILLVAFGNPKQEKWLAMYRDRLTVPVCIGVGASIDFFSGKQSRAPQWMQRAGLEWISRLANEPGRLGSRYARCVWFVLRHMLLQLLVTLTQRSEASEMAFTLVSNADALIVSIKGDLTGERLIDLDRALGPELLRGVPVIMDFSATSTIWPDGAGLLAGLKRRTAHQQTPVWLVGLKPWLGQVLRSTFPAGHSFRSAASLAEALTALGSRTMQLNPEWPEVNFRPAIAGQSCEATGL